MSKSTKALVAFLRTAVAYSQALRKRLGLVRGKWSRRSLWQRSARYWRLRDLADRFRFRFHRFRYTGRRRSDERRASLSIGVQLARAVFWPGFLALLSIAVLAIVERAIRLWLPAIPTSKAPAYLQRPLAYLLRPFEALSAWLNSISSDASALATMLGTIAQVAGVFLGLYFATLSLLASSSYRDVPSDLRAVVVEERAGTLYLQLVAFTGAVALGLLGLGSIGFPAGTFAVTAIAFLSIASTLSFLPLGLRAFSFFDPGALAAHLSQRIEQFAFEATSRGYLWDDRHFQAHSQKQASHTIDILRSLVEVTAGTVHSARSMLTIGKRSLTTLRHYSVIKANIPPTSYWYERVPRHPSWLTAGGTEIEGLIHGIPLMPKEAPDELWMEKRVIDIVGAAIRHLLNNGCYREAHELLDFAAECVDSLAYQLRLDIAELLASEITSLAPLAVGRPPAAGSSETFRLAAIEAIFRIPPAAIAAVGRATERLTASSIEPVADTSTKPETAPLDVLAPPGVVEGILFFRRALAFERDAEGHAVTPTWFLKHCIAAAYCGDIKRIFDTLISLTEDTYRSKLTDLLTANAHESAVLAIQRGREACHKLNVHSENGAMATARLQQELRRPFRTQKWTLIDPTAIAARADALDAELLRTLAKVAVELRSDVPSGGVPDAFGYACTTLAQEAFSALLAERARQGWGRVQSQQGLFADLFPIVVELSFKGFERTRKELEQQPPSTQLTIAADVLLDLMEVSGYAYLDSAIFGGNAWAVVTSAWAAFLKPPHDAGWIVRTLLGVDAYRAASIAMTGRDIIRTSWSRRFDVVLGDLGCSRSRSMSFPFQEERAVIPVDPLAAAYLDVSGLGGHARTVFEVALLVKHSASNGIRIPRHAESLIDDVERVERRREEQSSHPESDSEDEYQ